MNNAATPTGLTTLTVNAGDGNDAIDVIALPDASAGGATFTGATLHGDSGDDSIDAGAITVDTPITMSGGVGKDTLTGGAGSDSYSGNEDDDLFIASPGSDTLDGGAGFDTLLINGTPSNDTITVNQTSASALSFTVTPTVGTTYAATDTLVLAAGTPTVESASVDAQAGADVVTVTWADSLGVDGIVNSLRYDIDGGDDSTQDRLGVIDSGTGDLVLYRKGESDSTGSITVGPANAEPLVANFQRIEQVQPVAAADGEVQVFKHDPYEFNDTRLVATHLGAAATINLDPTIDPGACAAEPACRSGLLQFRCPEYRRARLPGLLQ